MPWTPNEVSKHNKTSQKKKWASVANSVLAQSGDDAKAIRIANSVVKRRIDKKKKERNNGSSSGR